MGDSLSYLDNLLPLLNVSSVACQHFHIQFDLERSPVTHDFQKIHGRLENSFVHDILIPKLKRITGQLNSAFKVWNK